MRRVLRPFANDNEFGPSWPTGFVQNDGVRPNALWVGLAEFGQRGCAHQFLALSVMDIYNASITHVFHLPWTQQKMLVGFDVVNLLDQKYFLQYRGRRYRARVAPAGCHAHSFLRRNVFLSDAAGCHDVLRRIRLTLVSPAALSNDRFERPYGIKIRWEVCILWIAICALLLWWPGTASRWGDEATHQADHEEDVLELPESRSRPLAEQGSAIRSGR